MQPINSSSRWRQWLRLSRLLPLLTLLAAGTALTLSLLNRFELRTAEQIVIGLLGLLAVDALSERISVLARIETALSNLSGSQPLRRRVDILPVEEQAAQASEICILAISAITVILRCYSFFETKLREGCHIRLILPDPDSPSLQTLNLLTKYPSAKADIGTTLQHVRGLLQTDGTKGTFEVRLSNVFPPFSIFAVDLNRDTGSMVVEYLGYKTALSERPHVFLTNRDNSHWFEFYKQQLERAWSEASLWSP